MPVVDLAVLFGLGQPATARAALYRHLILLKSESPMALLVDRVADVVRVEQTQVRPVADGATLNGCVCAEIRTGERLVHGLAVDRILLAEERDRVAAQTRRRRRASPSGRPEPDMRPLKGAAPTGDPAFAALKSRLVARTGHHYYADKDDLLWERVGRRMRARGVPDPAGYLAVLEGSEGEWAALESEITIGETFFFRYAEQFAALRGTILPERIAARGAERRLRIWSAGCSTGPETYSVGIVLHELLGERLPDWRIGLTGTDINRDVLGVARRAVYGTWALRTLGAEERERYFRPGPREGTFALRPEFRGLARFEPQNLMSLLDGTASLALTDYDLILCRNVLIYFHPDVVQALVRALAQRLRPAAGCCWAMPSRTRPSRSSCKPSRCRAPPPIAAGKKGGRIGWRRT